MNSDKLNPSGEIPDKPREELGSSPVSFGERENVGNGESVSDTVEIWKYKSNQEHRLLLQFYVFCKQEDKELLLQFIRTQFNIMQDDIKAFRMDEINPINSVVKYLEDNAENLTAIKSDKIMLIVEGFGDLVKNISGEASHGYNQVISEFEYERRNPYQKAGKKIVLITIVTNEDPNFKQAIRSAAFSQFKDGVLELK